jgi:hypothetical protein
MPEWAEFVGKKMTPRKAAIAAGFGGKLPKKPTRTQYLMVDEGAMVHRDGDGGEKEQESTDRRRR